MLVAKEWQKFHEIAELWQFALFNHMRHILS